MRYVTGLTIFSPSLSLKHSSAVIRMTSANGTNWQKTNHTSIILTKAVVGSICIFPIEIVVIICIVVRFTLKAASKKNGLKKVVAKVMIIKRMEGRDVVKSSFITFLFKFRYRSISSLGATN